MGRAQMSVGAIVGALMCTVVTAFAVYLLVEALRTGTALAPPASRYRRASNPFHYWLAVLGIVIFGYMGLFTLVGLLRSLIRGLR